MDDEKWLERRYYGGDLPAEAERALHAVGLTWDDEAASEAHIRTALHHAPNHLAVHYGAYKFFYYRRRYMEALPHLEGWIDQALARNHFPKDWRQVTSTHADFNNFDGEPRVFLFALRAYGWLLARMRRTEEGRGALKKVAELDAKDKMGALRLLALIDEPQDSEAETA
jgi:hypothetical protein